MANTYQSFAPRLFIDDMVSVFCDSPKADNLLKTKGNFSDFSHPKLRTY